MQRGNLFFFLLFLPCYLNRSFFCVHILKQIPLKNRFAFTQVMIYKKGKTLSILYISSLCAQDLTLFSAQLCAKLYYQATMEKLSFCLPCQLSMSLVVKTVPESAEDFVILKTASRGTESSRPDHHGDERYNIWINIQIKI